MTRFGSLIALLLLCAPAMAAEPLHLAGRFGLGLGGGVAIPINNAIFRNTTDTGWMAEGHGDYYITDAFGIEAQYTHVVYQNSSPLNNTYTLGFNYRWWPTSRITPVLGVGAGWGTSTAKNGLDGDYNNWFGVGKIGFDIALSDCTVLGLSAKYAWLFSKVSGDRDQQSIVPQANITFFFGGKRESAIEPIATPTPTPEAAPVDGDSDNDGVKDSMDRCPGTPTGAKVNSFGCQVNEAVNEKVNIEFASGKSVIPADYTSEADKIVSMMKEHEDVTAEIQGYTDNVGKKASNVKLSQARANSVKNYIVKHGIAKNRVTAKGYGDANPEADNSTAEGRKQNRRVIASLKSKATAESNE